MKREGLTRGELEELTRNTIKLFLDTSIERFGPGVSAVELLGVVERHSKTKGGDA